MTPEVPKAQVAYLATECEDLISVILDELGVEAEVDERLLRQVSTYFLRDLYRLDQQQRGTVSLAKYAGYWGFWIRKLKPISNPQLVSLFLEAKDLEFINEMVAVYLAIQVVVDYRGETNRGNPETFGFGPAARDISAEIVRSSCENKKPGHCDGVACFKRYADNYIHFNDRFFLNYITYSMRNRTFGPHHFALLLESLIYSACPVVNGAAIED